MTIKDLKKIIANLPEETVILIEEPDYNEVNSILVDYHSDGRIHLIFSCFD